MMPLFVSVSVTFRYMLPPPSPPFLPPSPPPPEPMSVGVVMLPYVGPPGASPQERSPALSSPHPPVPP